MPPPWSFYHATGAAAATTCHVCWRPFARCACPASAVIRDSGEIAALERLRLMVDAGCWADTPDRHNAAQQRWAFLLWRLDSGQVGPG